MYKNNLENLKISSRGITLIALVVTIIILLIIAGIGIYGGTNTVKKVKLEELRTNMLLIEAKAREYVEEANFRIGNKKGNTEEERSEIENIKQEIYENGEKGAKLIKASGLTGLPSSIPVSNCYVITEDTLKLWGLNKIKLDSNEKYLLEFDENNLSVEVYNTKGYEGKYSLTDIENNN